MKKNDVQIGHVYTAKVTNKLVQVRINADNPHGGWDATNLATGKQVRIKSAQRLRSRVETNDISPPVATTQAGSSDTSTSQKKRRTGERDATGGTQDNNTPMSLLDAAATVLAQHDEALGCREMVNRAIESGLWNPRAGKTPANTLNAAIAREIATKGDDARFRKAERGKFTLA